MKKKNSTREKRGGFGCSAWLGVWINAVMLLQALSTSVRMVYPQLPKWLNRLAVRHDVFVTITYDSGHLGIHDMNPLSILSKEGIKVALRRLWLPLFKGAHLLRHTVVMYRWLKLDRTRKAASETVRECVACAHTPNDPSSATRPTGRTDCNSDATAGFAAAHG